MLRSALWASWAVLACSAFGLAPAQAADCPVTHDQLVKALKAAVKPASGPANGGFESHEWASVVARDGTLCAIAFSGDKPDDQWPGSRVVSMAKANTANGFSTKVMALSTANLFAQSQPGQSLYGIITASPPSPEASQGDAVQFGSGSDPALGKRIGGTITFGGGLALYDGSGPVGGLGISGDSSCADHNVAWRIRQALGLDKTPQKDTIKYDLGSDGKSASGFGHPKCAGYEADIAGDIGASGTASLTDLRPK
jgi:uncharacterized protein GlcG (DUF336 family)